MSYQFTNDWFAITAEQNFADILPRLKPKRILEIGAYEGRATVWMARNLLPDQLLCIDTWKGGDDHKSIDMSAVWDRFVHNRTELQKLHNVYVNIMTGESAKMLSDLCSERREFDFVYIDGSHRAADVMTDAVFAFQLLPKGGVMAFDDYAWTETANEVANPLDNPRLGIDAFFNVFRRHLAPINCTNSQFWAMKI